MLLIWTGASSDMIAKTFGASLKLFGPNVPEHVFVPYGSPDDPPPHVEKGDVCLVCGLKPLETLRRASLVHKGKTVSSMRETPIKVSVACRPPCGFLIDLAD